ncbi:MAG: hypothetical protein R2822_18390 [Spirosomataceae bacterium]
MVIKTRITHPKIVIAFCLFFWGNQNESTQPAVVHSSSIAFFAIRKGDWKLIEGRGSGGFTEPQEIQPKDGEATGQLYHLATDISEKKMYTPNTPTK